MIFSWIEIQYDHVENKSIYLETFSSFRVAGKLMICKEWESRITVCLFKVFCPTREFFTHMETSQLPMEGFKFWTMLSTHVNWGVTLTAFSNRAVTTCFYDLGLSRLGIKHPTCKRSKCSHRLLHRRSYLYWQLMR